MHTHRLAQHQGGAYRQRRRTIFLRPNYSSAPAERAAKPAWTSEDASRRLGQVGDESCGATPHFSVSAETCIRNVQEEMVSERDCFRERPTMVFHRTRQPSPLMLPGSQLRRAGAYWSVSSAHASKVGLQ